MQFAAAAESALADLWTTCAIGFPGAISELPVTQRLKAMIDANKS
jgi:hypothetical protein